MIFSPVDHAADVTVQGDVVEVEVSGLDFTGVLLGPVALNKKSTVTICTQFLLNHAKIFEVDEMKFLVG